MLGLPGQLQVLSLLFIHVSSGMHNNASGKIGKSAAAAEAAAAGRIMQEGAL